MSDESERLRDFATSLELATDIHELADIATDTCNYNLLMRAADLIDTLTAEVAKLKPTEADLSLCFQKLSSPPTNGTYWVKKPGTLDIFLTQVMDGNLYYFPIEEPVWHKHPVPFYYTNLQWGPRVLFNWPYAEFPIQHPRYAESHRELLKAIVEQTPIPPLLKKIADRDEHEPLGPALLREVDGIVAQLEKMDIGVEYASNSEQDGRSDQSGSREILSPAPEVRRDEGGTVSGEAGHGSAEATDSP